MRMTQHGLTKGDKVQGMYNGTPFIGVIREREAINAYMTVYTVDLTTPIREGRTVIAQTQDVRDELTDVSDWHWIEKI